MLLGTVLMLGQTVSGYVLDSENQPIPFANIFVKETQAGTSTDIEGKYFLSFQDGGEYEFVISSIGYKTKTVSVFVADDNLETNLNFALESSSTELNEIVVKAGKKDPAYEIIQKVIDNKKKYQSQIKTWRSQVYLRATEILDKKKKEAPVVEEEEETVSPMDDPFEDKKGKKKKKSSPLDNLAMVEMQLTLNYSNPNKYKEERTAFKKFGSQAGLFIPTFGESSFDFYDNMVDTRAIADAPIISPISRTAILSYKYKLEEILTEDKVTVYKIKVIPRKSGFSTCKGYLYINDGTWNINRLDLNFTKGALKFYDDFQIKQSYQNIQDSLWIPFKQEFIYQTKKGRKATFKGNTYLYYSDFEKDYPFPENFFGQEVSITTKEAYEKDTTFWKETRPEPLTADQEIIVYKIDSVQTLHNSIPYKDSIENEFNKIKVDEILYLGVGKRNHRKKQSIFVGPVASFLSFDIVSGFRIGPFLSYFRRFENGKMFRVFGNTQYSLNNKDANGSLSSFFRYNPHKLADVNIGLGRQFQSINPYDAFLNQLNAANYILHYYYHLDHKFEIINGLYLTVGGTLHDRQSLSGYPMQDVLFDDLNSDDPIEFNPYKAFISETKLSFTPRQRFMTEPNRKIVLGSKFPTFSLLYRKGWDGILSSSIDFDYFEAEIKQKMILGFLGNMNYTITAGQFVNTKDLRFVDLKRFRQSDPYLFSNPLKSFQLLDTALVARDPFVEAHVIHHFNGALMNNVPLIKKLRIRTVAGAGAMWVQESNFRHAEIMAGIERAFKLGPRRRLKIGFYGVLAESNYTKPKTDWKISFDIIDTWKKDWCY